MIVRCSCGSSVTLNLVGSGMSDLEDDVAVAFVQIHTQIGHRGEVKVTDEQVPAGPREHAQQPGREKEF